MAVIEMPVWDNPKELTEETALVVIYLERCDENGIILDVNGNAISVSNLSAELIPIIIEDPSTYSAITSTLVDAQRNSEGYVISSVIRDQLAKITMNWKYLTADNWARLNECFMHEQILKVSDTKYARGYFYNYIKFFNQDTNSYDTRQMYVGNRTAGLWRRDSVTKVAKGWTSPSFSLIEV